MLEIYASDISDLARHGKTSSNETSVDCIILVRDSMLHYPEWCIAKLKEAITAKKLRT